MQSDARSYERHAPMGPIEIVEPSDLYRYFLPYVIVQVSDGSYIFLNRHHKPVGMVSHNGDWADYETCSQRFHVCRLTPEVARKVSVRGSPNTARIVLYDDGCRPQDSDKNRRTYLARLKLFYDLVEVRNIDGMAAEADAAAH